MPPPTEVVALSFTKRVVTILEDCLEIGQADGEFWESAEAFGGAGDGMDTDGEGGVAVKPSSFGRTTGVTMGGGLPPLAVFMGPDEIDFFHREGGGMKPFLSSDKEEVAKASWAVFKKSKAFEELLGGLGLPAGSKLPASFIMGWHLGFVFALVGMERGAIREVGPPTRPERN